MTDRADEVAYLAATQATANDHGFWGNARTSNGPRLVSIDTMYRSEWHGAELVGGRAEDRSQSQPIDLSDLTPIQLEVADGLAGGMTREEIARLMRRPISTINYAVWGIRKKLEAA